jgi:hypothetical protein
MRLDRAALLCGCWLLAAVAPATAQILTGNVIGIVRDDQGGVLPGAAVTLTSATALPQGPMTQTTDGRGQYRFVGLQPGTYELTIALQGFATYDETGIRVEVNGTVERTVPMKLAAVSETVTVSGEAPVVDARRVGLSANVDQETVERIPQRRFGVFDFMKAAPGVASQNPSGTGTGMSVFGAATGENLFLIDGVVFNSPAGGGAWAFPDSDVVAEMEVSTLGASAEYAQAQGAVFNLVTKSGTNTFRGEFSNYIMPDRFVSKPVLRPCNCPLGQSGFVKSTNRDITLHAGGPIIYDKLWFYGGYTWNYEEDSQPGVNPATPRKYLLDRPIVKLTWQGDMRTRITAMWRDDPWNIPATASAANPIETTTESGGTDPQYAFEVNRIVTNTTNLSVRVSGWVAPNDYVRPVASDTSTPFHRDSLTGIASGGATIFGKAQKGIHAVNAKLSHFARDFVGADHDFKFGVQTERGNSNQMYGYAGGVHFYDIGGRPDQASYRDPYVAGGAYHREGAYAEDQATIKSRLTLSIGGRYDHVVAQSQDLPAVDRLLNKSGGTVTGLGTMYTWNLVSPRLGFNYRLTGDGKTIVRGNVGRSYRPVFTNELARVHPGLTPITLRRFDPATGAYTTLISVTDSKANLRIDPDTEAPITTQYSVGADRELARNVGLSVTYVRKNGSRQIGWRDIGGVYGTGSSTQANGQVLPTFPLVNNASQRLFMQTNGPGLFTTYNGLVMAVRRRFADRWQGTASYTLSRAKGLLTSGATQGRDPNDYTNLEGDLSNDRRHMFTFQGALEVPKIDVMVSTQYQLMSGLPYAPQTTVTLAQGRRTINLDAPGSFRYPRVHELMLRVAKRFPFGSHKVEVMADGQNLLQTVTPLSLISQNFFAATFSQAATWNEPRRLLLGVRLTY